MRIALCAGLLCFSAFLYGREKSDSVKTKLMTQATVSLNSNGISSIPAFSLDKPAIIASLALTKNRFSYEPVLAYGLDLRPWFIDNWLRYKIINRPAFELRTGFNISSFFSEFKLEDTTAWQAQRYFALELTGTYKFSPNSSLALMYWNDRGQEPGTLKGHFINLMYDRSNIPVGQHMLLGVNLQLFYINYDGDNDGLFITPRISSGVRNLPFSLFFQAIQALASNIEPWPEFRWNVGLGYTL
jgi:hypothetical protein